MAWHGIEFDAVEPQTRAKITALIVLLAFVLLLGVLYAIIFWQSSSLICAVLPLVFILVAVPFSFFINERSRVMKYIISDDEVKTVQKNNEVDPQYTLSIPQITSIEKYAPSGGVIISKTMDMNARGYFVVAVSQTREDYWRVNGLRSVIVYTDDSKNTLMGLKKAFVFTPKDIHGFIDTLEAKRKQQRKKRDEKNGSN